MKTILLITHDTSLSGAPKSLLLVFEYLVKKGYRITTVAITGKGRLEQRFKDISNEYYCLNDYKKEFNYSLKNRLKKKIFGRTLTSEYESILNSISLKAFDLIYCNTIVSLTLGLKINEKIKTKFILHIHELETVIDEFCPNISDFSTKIDVIIVPSFLNQTCLIEKYKLPKDKIHVIRETSDFNQTREKRNNFTNYINVLMCGGAYWRKGDDLFILIANEVLKKDKRFRFYWLGYQSKERKRVNQADLNKLHINEYVHFIEETESTIEWYLNSDIFLLTSREDPFPLAAIEAGMIGLPIFCFEKSTGIAEVLNPECVVPYLDICKMSDQLLKISTDEDSYFKITSENKSTFINFIPEKIAEEVMKLL
ncbi:MAG: glycosyltransferase family 4 protein [Bacteroidia bacterium]|nr:glycosyltransferase family 4 protein [Bacteroidia bacterium]